jgi:hypothetical protein
MLSTSDLVDVWEWGCNRHTVDRALLLLSRALPDWSWSDLATLSIGRRNEHLLELHEHLFGRQLDCRVTCPACASELEFALDTHALTADRSSEEHDNVRELRDADIELRFRFLDSRDLVAAAHTNSVEQARQVLVDRTLLRARRAGIDLSAIDLPDSSVAALADQLEQLDRPILCRLSLTCQNCGHEWPANLDIVSYLWTKITSHARHALADVHELARAYGWSEADVFGMSDARRQEYLSLVRG